MNKQNKKYTLNLMSSLLIIVACGGCNSNSGNNDTEMVSGGVSKSKATQTNYGGHLSVATATKQEWKYSYNAKHLLEAITDPNGNITKYDYTQNGELSSIKNALNHQIIFSRFDNRGNPQTVYNTQNRATFLEYTPQGWLKEITFDDAITSFTYDKVGNLTSYTTPDGVTFTYTYDEANYLMEVHAPYGVIKYTRDNAGNITSSTISGADGISYSDQRSYDEINRLLKITTAITTQSFTYDNDDNLTSSTDGRNNKMAMSWDDLQRLSSETDAKSGVSKYVYENTKSIENPSSIMDAKGTNTSYQYNGLDALLSLVSPDSGSHSAAYDANGNLLEQLDAKGQLITYTYDAINRLTSINYASDPSLNTTYVYNGVIPYHNPALLMEIKDANTGVFRFSYDNRGNMEGTEQVIDRGDGIYYLFPLKYSYDQANHITRVSYPYGSSYGLVDYSYNHGQLERISVKGKTIADITHLPFGPINQLSYANGVTEKLSYNTDYSLKQQSLSNGLLDHEYSYYPNGQIKNISNVGSYDYDQGNSLTKANDSSYSYDNTQNMTTQTNGGITTNYQIQAGSNRLLSRTINAVTSEYQYDNNGNIIRDGDKVYHYDSLNRLKSVEQGGETIVSYKYNVMSQRTAKIMLNETIIFTYDLNGQLMEEYNLKTKDFRNYIYAEGKLIAFIDDDKVYYVVTDHLNAPLLVMNEAGAQVWSATYDPFGKATITATSNMKLNLRADGQYEDSETGLYYNGYRYYNPSLGRYITSDPLGLQAGMNTYIYVNGNPINYTDPQGLCPWCAFGAVVGVYSSIASQLYQNGWDPTKLDAKQVFISGLVGAASGGLGTLTYAYRASLPGVQNALLNILGNTYLGVGQQVANNYLDGNKCGIMDGVPDSMKSGIVSNTLGYGAGMFANSMTNATKTLYMTPRDIKLQGWARDKLPISQNYWIGGSVAGNVAGTVVPYFY